MYEPSSCVSSDVPRTQVSKVLLGISIWSWPRAACHICSVCITISPSLVSAGRKRHKIDPVAPPQPAATLWPLNCGPWQCCLICWQLYDGDMGPPAETHHYVL